MFRKGVPSLERQIAFYADDAAQRLDNGSGAPSGQQQDDGFVWGVSPLTKIPTSLLQIWKTGRSVPAAYADHPQNIQARQSQVLPWLGLTVSSMLLAVWGLRRRPMLLLAFVGVLPPFLLAVHGASFVLYHVRHLANGYAVIPVFVGVAVAVMAQGALLPSDRKAPSQGHIKNLALPVLVGLLVTGIIPSWFAQMLAGG